MLTLFIPKSLYRAAVSAPIPLSQPLGSCAHIKFTTSCTLTLCSRCQTSKWHVISKSVWLSAFLGKQDPHREWKWISGYETREARSWEKDGKSLSLWSALCRYVSAHPRHTQRKSKRKQNNLQMWLIWWENRTHNPDGDIPVAHHFMYLPRKWQTIRLEASEGEAQTAFFVQVNLLPF